MHFVINNGTREFSGQMFGRGWPKYLLALPFDIFFLRNSSSFFLTRSSFFFWSFSCFFCFFCSRFLFFSASFSSFLRWKKTDWESEFLFKLHYSVRNGTDFKLRILVFCRLHTNLSSNYMKLASSSYICLWKSDLIFAELVKVVETTCNKLVDKKSWQSTCIKPVDNLQQTCYHQAGASDANAFWD